ncbi:hypothetical protein ETD86_29355 [Nonomuraea turkmeniaca]|uniref:Uncharacterized protein n=1 Tax=Nonomuraea turkmeniaca TaxID=103838 RepID=A0A5S4FA90_9ACTN|nr:hypothetical protein [Nonomuraea turkmeniaca]TMR14136.1 hypothetical protein ETD86_29355 [Nonomuraea turkmeniaca]
MKDKNTSRPVCIEGYEKNAQCRDHYSGSQGSPASPVVDMCNGGTNAYVECRGRGSSGSRDGCQASIDAYACSYKGNLATGIDGYGISDKSACKGVAERVSSCHRSGGTGGDCLSAGVIQMDCIKRTNNKNGCTLLADDVIRCILSANDAKQTGCDDKPVSVVQKA